MAQRRRPWTVVVLVVVGIVDTLYSTVVEFGLVSILVALVYLALLKSLWDGSRVVRQLFLFFALLGTGLGVVRSFDDPAGFLDAGWSALVAGLLLAEPTREWCDRPLDPAPRESRAELVMRRRRRRIEAERARMKLR